MSSEGNCRIRRLIRERKSDLKCQYHCLIKTGRRWWWRHSGERKEKTTKRRKAERKLKRSMNQIIIEQKRSQFRTINEGKKKGRTERKKKEKNYLKKRLCRGEKNSKLMM